MLLVVPLLVGLLVATARGGSPARLGAVMLHGWSLVLGAVALQVILYLPGIREAPVTLRWGPLVYMLSLGLVLVAALRNWTRGRTIQVAVLGFALNLAVIMLNGGHMPVNVTALASAQGLAAAHALSSGQTFANTWPAGPGTRLALLTDVIPVRLAMGAGNVYSIGDVCIAGGIALFVYRTARRPS